MKFKEHSFFDIPVEIKRRNKTNELRSIVEQHMGPKQLTFSLIEMVLLHEQGIGETHIFANKKVDSNTVYKIYCELVNEFKEKHKGGVAAYKDWYKQRTWIASGTGKKSKRTYSISDYGWIGQFDKRNEKDYGRKNKLPPRYIQKYFDAYATRIVEIELKNYPHCLVIIQPIGKVEGNEVIPYGNLYLHFATLKKVNQHEIKKFLDAFMLVWYKCYGGHKHGEILQELFKAVLKSNKEIDYFLPKNLKTHQFDIQLIFLKYFTKDGNLLINIEKFIKRVECFREALSKLDTSDFSQMKWANEIRAFKKVKEVKHHLKFSESDFENFIFCRAMTIFLFINKKLSLTQTKNILQKQTRDKEPKYSSVILHFYNFYNISLSDAHGQEHEDKLRNELINSSSWSDFERSLIEKT